MENKDGKFSRSLIAYSIYSGILNKSKCSHMDALALFVKPIAAGCAGTMFDPDALSKEFKKRYYINIPSLVISGMAGDLESIGILENKGSTRGSTAYYYAQQDEYFEVPNDAVTSTVFDKFLEFARAEGIGINEIEDEALVDSFLDKMLNIESLRLVRQKDNIVKVKASKKTLTLSKASPLDEKVIFDKKIDFIVSEFILMSRDDGELYSKIEEMAFGNLVGETLLTFNDPPQGVNDLSGLSVYLDGPLLMDILGINKGRDKYGSELNDLLRRAGINVRVFYHTIDEVERVLDGHASSYNSTYPMSYKFIDTPEIRQRVNVYRGNVEGYIQDELLFEVVDTPSSINTHRATIKDEEEARLRELLYWHNDNEEARDADVKSIESLVELRSMAEFPTRIYDAREMFLTRNTALVSSGNKFFSERLKKVGKYSSAAIGRAVPIIMTDKQIAGVAWLLHGGGNKEVARSRLIANCMTAVSPKNDVAAKVYNLLLDSSEEDAKRFEAVITNQRAEALLNKLTFGVPDVVTPENVVEFYEEVRKETASEVREEERKKAENRISDLSKTYVSTIIEKTKLTEQAQAEAMMLRDDVKSVSQKAESVTGKLDSKETHNIEVCFKNGRRVYFLLMILIVLVVTIGTYYLESMSSTGNYVFSWIAFALSSLITWRFPDILFGRIITLLADHSSLSLAKTTGWSDEWHAYVFDYHNGKYERKNKTN